jgi:hypothetical protein
MKGSILMRVNGLIAFNMELGLKSLGTVIYLKVIMIWGKRKGMEKCFIRLWTLIIKVSGKTIKEKDMEN